MRKLRKMNYLDKIYFFWDNLKAIIENTGYLFLHKYQRLNNMHNKEQYNTCKKHLQKLHILFTTCQEMSLILTFVMPTLTLALTIKRNGPLYVLK